MDRYAILNAGIVVNVVLAQVPEAEWVIAPRHVSKGWSFDGSTWAAPLAPIPYPTADDAKQAVKAWIETLLNQITDKYPRHEIDSWGSKNEAARAVVAGNARADQTALVQSEADAVGAALADQAGLIVAKADHFMAIISLTSGMRQQVGVALDAASTPEQFAAIVDGALVAASSQAVQYGLSVKIGL